VYRNHAATPSLTPSGSSNRSGSPLASVSRAMTTASSVCCSLNGSLWATDPTRQCATGSSAYSVGVMGTTGAVFAEIEWRCVARAYCADCQMRCSSST
jgi:hypothetical protein